MQEGPICAAMRKYLKEKDDLECLVESSPLYFTARHRVDVALRALLDAGYTVPQNAEKASVMSDDNLLAIMIEEVHSGRAYVRLVLDELKHRMAK